MTPLAKALVVLAIVAGICIVNFVIEAVARSFGSSLLGVFAIVCLSGVIIALLVNSVLEDETR